MPHAPWTDLGRVEQDIGDIKSSLHRKAESHEIYTLSGRLDSLERTCREIRADADGIQSRLQELERAQVEEG